MIPIYSVMMLYAACAPITVSGGLQHLTPLPSSVLLTFIAISFLFLSIISNRELISLKSVNKVGALTSLSIALPALLSLIGVLTASLTLLSVNTLTI